MFIVGIILIIIVVSLYIAWLQFQRKQERAELSGGVQEVTVLVKGAYDPNEITVQSGVPLLIHFNRQEDAECSRFVTFDQVGIRKELKPFSMTDVEFTPKQAGEIPFTCDMGMYQGKIIVAE